MTRLKILMITLFAGIFFACNQSSNTTDSEKPKSGESRNAVKTPKKNILFFGNSLTAGYGLDDPANAFPGLIQHTVDSLNLPYNCVNAGLSGETTAGGNSRIDWLLKQPVDVFVLELGANDGLRGLDVQDTYKNLQSIISKVKSKYPSCKIVLTGMMVPPNMGENYASDFAAVYPRLAKENNIALVPFLLQDVAGVRKLNQGDGIHPTEEGQKIVTENVWKVLKDQL
ncbi:arylesterase [Pedobacter sp. HMF7647]|uniref:Arylesterase n=1 Tax=Hufsiella arboris TaxID=2695275 RepID=A0A7K1YA71_9SPHI|nr:arylesterase [Hufsiella arboris]MXV51251.1 arylesterase [Hufsiella arboris]